MQPHAYALTCPTAWAFAAHKLFTIPIGWLFLTRHYCPNCKSDRLIIGPPPAYYFNKIKNTKCHLLVKKESLISMIFEVTRRILNTNTRDAFKSYTLAGPDDADHRLERQLFDHASLRYRYRYYKLFNFNVRNSKWAQFCCEKI